MQKAKQESTRFVASCSTKKYPFSLFLKKFQKLKWNSGHRYVAFFLKTKTKTTKRTKTKSTKRTKNTKSTKSKSTKSWAVPKTPSHCVIGPITGANCTSL